MLAATTLASPAALNTPRGGTRPAIESRRAAIARAWSTPGPTSYRLPQRLSAPFATEVPETFMGISSEDWHVTEGPSDDVCTQCFLAPEWMGLAPDAWVCTDSATFKAPLTSEDSY